MKPRERILFLSTSYPSYLGDAAGHFVQSEVEMLRDEGHEVVVAATGGPFEDTRVIDLGASNLFSHPGALPRLRENPWRLRSLLSATRRARDLLEKQGRFDRIVCHWLVPTAFPWGYMIRHRASSLTAVAHGSDIRLLSALPAPLRLAILFRLHGAGFQLRFVSSQLKLDLLKTRLPPSLAQFVEGAAVRPSPIDCSKTPTKQNARSLLRLDQEETWAVVVGRLIAGKRPHVALSAAQLIPNVKVAVLGAGPLLNDLKRAHPEVRFLGQLPRQETLMWISAADILLSASQAEGAPTTIREARTLGTSVVSSQCGDLVAWSQYDPALWIVAPH